jgi:hypothetical protein
MVVVVARPLEAGAAAAIAFVPDVAARPVVVATVTAPLTVRIGERKVQAAYPEAASDGPAARSGRLEGSFGKAQKENKNQCGTK